MNDKLRLELILARIEQREAVTDRELAEVGVSLTEVDGWWHDSLDFTWRWAPQYIRDLVNIYNKRGAL